MRCLGSCVTPSLLPLLTRSISSVSPRHPYPACPYLYAPYHLYSSSLSKQGFQLDIPSRAASNQIYVPELDRIVLGDKRGTRSFLNVKESRKAAITTRVLQLLHAVLQKRIHITKRDLFYTDVKLFVDQSDSDGVLDDVATMIGCTRSNLHVVASDKGLV